MHADEAIAVFGASQTHEDDPVRAVLAALELRDKAREHGRDATAGISTGHARFGTGEPVEIEEPAGPGQPLAADSLTTIARRLRGEAGPGEILVGESTYNYLFGSFPASPRPLGTRRADGSATAYLIQGRDPDRVAAHGIARQQTEFVGRAREYALLEGAFARVMGGAGQMVSIIGEAGVGKTRLVAELRKRTLSVSAGAGPPRWLEGHCLELAATAAYWPFIDMLGRHFKLAPRRIEEAHALLVTEELQRLRRRGSLAAERLEEIAPLLGRLLSIRYGTEWDRRLAHAQPEQVRHQTFLAIRDLVLALAGERPLVIVLEDLQWADTLSLDVISLLMESVTIAPFMLVCVYRPEADHGSRHLAALASRKCPDRYTEIGLRELTPEESRRLIHALLSVDALPPDVRDAILAQCQGNPFFVEEVVRSLIDAGVVYRDGDRWRAREGAATAIVPETVQSVILGRVDRLESRLREVLESASVIGRIFQRKILERAVEAEQATEEALAELEARALIYLDKPGPQEEYSFRHVLTQQAVYQSILQRRRAELHERIAGVMEGLYTASLDDCCVELAHHYVRAGNKERAAEYLLMAGEKAAAAHMNEEALGHLRGALELLGPDDAPQERYRMRVLAEMGKVHEVKGEHSLAESRFREAAETGRRLGASPGERAQILYLLCKSLTARHRPHEYVPLAHEALALVGKGSESPEALMLEFVVAYSSFDLEGDFTALCDYAALRGQRIRSLPYSPDNTINATYLAWAYLIAKNEPAAMGWLEWAEEQAREHNDLVCLAAIHVRKGRDMLARCGDGDGAAEAVQEAAGLYHMTGARYLEVRCHLCLGDIHYRFGRLGEAEASSARAGELCAELRHDVHLAAEHELLKGQLALARGEAEKAIGHFQAALAASPGRQWECFLRFLTGRTLVAQGRHEEAARCLLELLEQAREFRMPPAYFLTVGPAHILSLMEDCSDGPEAFRAACEPVRRSRSGACASPAQWYLEPARPMPSGGPVTVRGLQPAPRRGVGVAEHPEGLRAPNGERPRCFRRDRPRPRGYKPERPPSSAGNRGRRRDPGRVRERRTRQTSHRGAGDLEGPGELPATGPGDRGSRPRRLRRLHTQPGSSSWDAAASARSVCSFASSGPARACVRLPSTGGDRWYTVGRAEFPAEDPLYVGLFADGAIRPEVYLRIDREGSEIRFTETRAVLAAIRRSGRSRQGRNAMGIGMKTPGLHHLALRVTDYGRAKRFYLETLGFPLLLETENLFIFAAGATAIGVRGPDAITPPGDRFSPFRVGLDHLALGCGQDAELQRVARALAEAGITNTGIKLDPTLNKRYVAFKDPDGISWEFYSV